MIRFQGNEYPDIDIENVSIEELREIKRKLGLSIGKFMEGTEELDPFALTAMYWLMMRSDGKHDDLVLSAKLDFPWMEFASAWADSAVDAKKAADEAKALAAEDPTQADPDASLPDTGTPDSTGSSAATSEKSATTTSSRSHATADSQPAMSTG